MLRWLPSIPSSLRVASVRLLEWARGTPLRRQPTPLDVRSRTRSMLSESTCVRTPHRNYRILLSNSQNCYVANRYPARPEHVPQTNHSVNVVRLLFLKNLRVSCHPHLPDVLNAKGVTFS